MKYLPRIRFCPTFLQRVLNSQHTIGLVPSQFMLNINRSLSLYHKTDQTQTQEESSIRVLLPGRKLCLGIWTSAPHGRTPGEERWPIRWIWRVVISCPASFFIVLVQQRLLRSPIGRLMQRGPPVTHLFQIQVRIEITVIFLPQRQSTLPTCVLC